MLDILLQLEFFEYIFRRETNDTQLLLQLSLNLRAFSS